MRAYNWKITPKDWYEACKEKVIVADKNDKITNIWTVKSNQQTYWSLKQKKLRVSQQSYNTTKNQN